MSVLAFDVELDKLVPPYDGDVSWETPSKPKVTCAATCELETGKTRTYWSPSEDGSRLASAHLSQYALTELIDDLYSHVCRGGVVLSWGGTAVDFRALHGSVQDDAHKRMCLYLTMNHIDVPFASSSDLGCMFSLNSAAKAMGLGGKDASISAAAPQMWSNGAELEVLGHVQGDAILTALVYSRALNPLYNPHASMSWITQRGKIKTWKPTILFQQRGIGGGNGEEFIPQMRPPRMQTVQECMSRPKPIVPFVTPHGLDRDFAIKWMEKASSSD